MTRQESKQSKAVPVTGHRRLEMCEMLRFPLCLGVDRYFITPESVNKLQSSSNYPCNRKVRWVSIINFETSAFSKHLFNRLRRITWAYAPAAFIARNMHRSTEMNTRNNLEV
jgi:hypothetical protein